MNPFELHSMEVFMAVNQQTNASRLVLLTLSGETEETPWDSLIKWCVLLSRGPWMLDR